MSTRGETNAPHGAVPDRRGGSHGSDPRHRKPLLFVALDLPDRVRREIDVWRRRELTDPALRITDDELRMNLLFLGRRRSQREVSHYLEAIRELCSRAPAPLVELCDGVPRGPQLSRPARYALPAKSTEAEVLQLSLRSVFAAEGLRFFEPKNRSFWLHVTVARLRIEVGLSRRPQTIQDLLDLSLPEGLQMPFRAEGMGLYCSEMRPAGIQYRLLGKAGFRGDR